MLNVIDISAPPYNASCNRTTDDTAAIEAAINDLPAGGKIIIPGQCNISSGLTVAKPITIEGLGLGFSGLFATGDNNLITFAANCDNACLRDISIYGKQDPGATQHNIFILNNACVHIERIRSWGGSSALYTLGVDCHIMDSYFMSSASNGGCIISNGANWYTRCKIDPSVWPVQWAFFQGTSASPGVTENRFVSCDFSGSASYSLLVDDAGANQADMGFSMCIFSSPVRIANAIWSGFNLCCFGSAISAGPNVPITMGDSWALSPTVVSGGQKFFSNNKYLS